MGDVGAYGAKLLLNSKNYLKIKGGMCAHD